MDRKLLPKMEKLESEESASTDSITVVSPSGSGEQVGKRRCISSACMPCRKRKSKCDGLQPSCTTCTTMYSSQCYYDLDSDRRRKGALKRDIAELKDEVRSQNIILEAIKRGPDSDIDDIIQVIRSNAGRSYDWIADRIQQVAISEQRTEASSLGGLEGELGADFTLKPASDTTGAVGHYGYTSNLALGLEAEQAPVDGDQVGDWTTVTSDPELFHHLLDVYFSWSHPIYLLFSEESFFHGLYGRKLKYCTPLLVNAILAVACHFSDRPEARADINDPGSVGSHFFAEAKRLFAQDDRSCLTTVQALGLMSLKQAMSSSDINGWQYAGQMISLTVQLGLHLPASSNGQMTPTEIEARRVTFWGVFIVNSIWALCVGRISSLPRAAIRLEKPRLIEQLETRPWRPHGNPDSGSLLSSLEQPSFKYSLLVHHSKLSEIVDDIVHMFYAPQDRITSRKLQQYHGKLQDWYKNLPIGLQVNRSGPTLPQVLTLHMSYHNCIIHLFRPFLKMSFVQGTKPPRMICTESANEISRLEDLYYSTYGFRRPFFIILHCIMSAAIIHLVNISNYVTTSTLAAAPSEHHEDSLARAIRDLHATRHCTALAHRYLKSLTTLIKKWCIHIPPLVQKAMSNAQLYSQSTTNASPGFVINPLSPEPTFEPSPRFFHENIDRVTLIATTRDNPALSDRPHPEILNLRKHSAPELVRMAPVAPHIDYSSNGGRSPRQQNHLWTPFPDASDGIPLDVSAGQQQNSDGGMSVTSLLVGEFPQLNQDGFMLSVADGDALQWSAAW